MRLLACTSAFGCLTFLCLAAASPTTVSAQDSMAKDGPPNVLVIQREYLKPGKGGSTHEKSESAFVKAMAAAKYPTYYFALDALTGPSRSLFLLSYDSFAAWEKDNLKIRADKALSAAFDKASLNDGDLLASYDTSAWALQPEMSLNSRGMKNAREFEMSLYFVKPGKGAEWSEIVKMYKDGYSKAVPGAHWDVFQLVYGNMPTGQTGDVYLVVTLMDSLAETDKGFLDFNKFAGSMGASGMKKMSELLASSVSSITTNVYEINPRMSYPPKSWMDADPFWKPAPMPVAKKPAPPAKP